MDVKIFIKQKKGLAFEEEAGRFTYSCCIESSTVESVIGNCVIDFENQRVCSHFFPKIEKIFNLPEEGYYAARSFNAYVALLKRFDIKLPATSSNKPHWEPEEAGVNFYWIGDSGYTQEDKYHYDFVTIKSNYNAFPTYELARKARNVSKLGRLILLWQYNNGCVYTPDIKDIKTKHTIKFNPLQSEIFCKDVNYTQGDLVYFETEEQCKAFIEMYQDEIKELWGIGDEQ